MKQMFDISAILVSERDEIPWSDNNLLGKFFMEEFVFGDEQVISFQRTKKGLRLFRFRFCVLVMYTRTSNQTLHGDKDWSGSKLHWNTETWTELTTSQWNSSGTFSQRSIRLLRPHETPENFTGRIIFMSMFNDISWGSKDNEKEI